MRALPVQTLRGLGGRLVRGARSRFLQGARVQTLRGVRAFRRRCVGALGARAFRTGAPRAGALGIGASEGRGAVNCPFSRSSRPVRPVPGRVGAFLRTRGPRAARARHRHPRLHLVAHGFAHDPARVKLAEVQLCERCDLLLRDAQFAVGPRPHAGAPLPQGFNSFAHCAQGFGYVFRAENERADNEEHQELPAADSEHVGRPSSLSAATGR